MVGGGGGAEAQRNSHQPAQRRHNPRLDQELRQHILLARADGKPDADLARAFGDRDQHDVHDSDAADDQADGRDRGEEYGENAGGGLNDLRDLGHVIGLEIVRRTSAKMPALPHQFRGVLLDLGHVFGAFGADPDHADIGVAGQASLHGAQRHDNQIVLVLAEGRLAARGKDADDFAGNVTHADLGAERILAAEQSGADGLTDDASRAAGTDFSVGEFAALHGRPI